MVRDLPNDQVSEFLPLVGLSHLLDSMKSAKHSQLGRWLKRQEGRDFVVSGHRVQVVVVDNGDAHRAATYRMQNH